MNTLNERIFLWDFLINSRKRKLKYVNLFGGGFFMELNINSPAYFTDYCKGALYVAT